MSTTPLSNTRELVERSIYHSIRKELIDKGYLPDMNELVTANISAITSNTFTLQNVNQALLYTAGREFTVENSTDLDGTYTVTSSVFSSPNTIVTVVQTITGVTVDGNSSIYKYYDDPTGVLAYKAALSAIVTNMGFAIEVFGSSNPQAKYMKKVPRIVIITNQSLPGGLGGAPDRVYTPSNPDPLNPGSYTASIQPPQTFDLTFDIHLVSNTAAQARVMHSIVGLAVPRRGYLSSYLDDTDKIFVHQLSYRSLTNVEQGINEDIYMYKAEDLFEVENTPVNNGNTISPIVQITVDTNEGDEDSSTHFNDQVID